MRISCSAFFCEDETSDSKSLHRNAIEFNPPKIQKVSLKKSTVSEMGIRSQNCFEAKPKKSRLIFESYINT